MYRRQFLTLVPAAAAASQRKKKQAEPPPPPPPRDQVRDLFLNITRGYLRNAERTSKSFAVVEYPNATITKNFLAKSGLSATGVTRMLPALASWIDSGREPSLNALDAVTLAFRNGCDPAHPDYWQPAKADGSDQRQVESSIVAWSLWLLRDKLLPKLSEADRRNISAWLTSCTRQPVRSSNWAWFTAVNMAVRLRLAEQWPEFQPEDPKAAEAFMLEDLKVLNSMAADESGWYNDGLHGSSFDYYNSWVFASHFLYWNAVTGDRYPELREPFVKRLSAYLETTPYFFAGNGAHVLYGRSLIYRWGVLTPLVLAYQQKLWPHSPGLLRRLVEQNILWHASIGAFDAEAGKLRETYTPTGSAAVRESYIDGGHPYWGMQAFAFWRIPDNDAFWTAPEEPLPVEKNDFTIALPEPGLLLVGTRSSGQVRLFNAKSSKDDVQYRDKYSKLTYSSHFPFAATHDKDHATWDNVLALRNRKTGETAVRGPISTSSVDTEKLELEYAIKLGAATAKVTTEVQVMGEFEARIHRVTLSGPLEDVDVIEGGVPFSPTPVYPEINLRAWTLKGWKENKQESCTGSLLYGSHNVQTLIAPAEAHMTLAAMRYQSPKAFTRDKIDEQAKLLLQRLRL